MSNVALDVSVWKSSHSDTPKTYLPEEARHNEQHQQTACDGFLSWNGFPSHRTYFVLKGTTSFAKRG